MINANDIKLMFDGIDRDTISIITHKHKDILSKVIININKYLETNNIKTTSLCPQPSLIMNAFRLCPISNVKVVLIGQDPYIGPKEANGCSFSTNYDIPIPKSLSAIYSCLLKNKLIDDMPTHGNLDSWAKQGVLLLNTALTTVLKQSNAHASIWEEYTTAVIKSIAEANPKCVFILLGKQAQKLLLISSNLLPNKCFTWGHPSPLNQDNADKTNPLHFSNCTVFSQVNSYLESINEQPINWSPNIIINERICNFTKDTIYLFTDGGARANGKANCTASWGYYILGVGNEQISSFGMVKPVDIKGKKFKSSNNRGELSAVLFGIEKLISLAIDLSFDKLANNLAKEIVIICDSEYSINCITKFYQSWIKDTDSLADKMNVDLISTAYANWKTLQSNTGLFVTFKHVRSHKTMPEFGTEAWFTWYGNDRVDNLCQLAFPKVIKS